MNDANANFFSGKPNDALVHIILFSIVNNRILLNEHSLFLLIQECRDNMVYLAPNLIGLLMFFRPFYALIIIIIKISNFFDKIVS